MVASCCAYGCENHVSKKTQEQGITFHKFPKDSDLLKKWLHFLRRKNFTSDTTVICSIHFKEGSFAGTSRRQVLLKGAVPQIFSAFPDHLRQDTKKRRVLTRQSVTATASVEELQVSVQDLAQAPIISRSDHDYSFLPGMVARVGLFQ